MSFLDALAETPHSENYSEISAEELLDAIGKEQPTSAFEMKEKMSHIKAFIFDWDGVFNSGEKLGGQGSPFNEADSMGINLLRLGYFLKYGQMPFTAIITGERNPPASYIAHRDHYDALYFKAINKGSVLKHLCQKHNLQPENFAFFFDDTLDLPVAKEVGMRFLINRNGAPLFREYCKKFSLADYITNAFGGGAGLREATEMALTLVGNPYQTISARVAFGEEYNNYLAARNSIQTEVFSMKTGRPEAHAPLHAEQES